MRRKFFVFFVLDVFPVVKIIRGQVSEMLKLRFYPMYRRII